MQGSRRPPPDDTEARPAPSLPPGRIVRESVVPRRDDRAEPDDPPATRVDVVKVESAPQDPATLAAVALRRELARLHDQATAVERSIEEHRRGRADALERLERATARIASLEGKVTTLDAANTKLERELDAASRAAEAAKASATELREARAGLERAARELSSAREHIASLEEEREAARADAGEQRALAAGLREELERTRAELEEARADAGAALERARGEAEEVARAAEKRRSELEALLTSERKAVLEVRARVADVEAELAQARREREAEAARAAALADARAALVAARAELEGARDDAAQAESRAASAEGRRAALEASMAKLRDDVAEAFATAGLGVLAGARSAREHERPGVSVPPQPALPPAAPTGFGDVDGGWSSRPPPPARSLLPPRGSIPAPVAPSMPPPAGFSFSIAPPPTAATREDGDQQDERATWIAALTDPERRDEAARALAEHPAWLSGRPPAELVLALGDVDRASGGPVMDLALAWKRQPLCAALVEALRAEDDWRIKDHGAWLVSKLAAASSCAAIADIARSEYEPTTVRRLLLDALELLASRGEVGWTEIGELAELLARHSEPLLREGVVALLAAVDAPEEKRVVLATMLRLDDDDEVLARAAEALAATPPVSLEPDVLDRLREHPSARVRGAAEKLAAALAP